MNRSASNQVLRGTIAILLVSILAKASSFFCDALLAAYLGTSAGSDAYYMVSGIQQVLFPMLSIGIWKVFLPLYKEHVTQGRLRETDRLANQSLTLFTLASAGVVVLLVLFADPLVGVVAPGFQSDTRALCVALVRIAAPKYIFITAAAIYASMLQSRGKFFASQIREVASYIPTILAALFFYRRYGLRVMAAALVLGGALRLLIELPFVDWGYRYQPDFRFRSDELRRMLRRLPSAFLTEATAQIHTLVDKAMASTLPEGTVSSMNYGSKLLNVLSGVLSSAVVTALYPQMIELLAQNKRAELSQLVTRILKLFLILMLPVTLACVLFSRELVTAVYQRGAFTPESTQATAEVFSMYALGILFTACNAVFDNLFYSAGDTKTPLKISVTALLINVSLNLMLIKLLGAKGLALATSLTAVLTLALRLPGVRKRMDLDGRSMAGTGGKALCCAAAACFVPRLLAWQLPKLNVYLLLLLSGLLGTAIYLLGLRLMGVEEYRVLKAQLLKKLKKQSQDESNNIK